MFARTLSVLRGTRTPRVFAGLCAISLFTLGLAQGCGSDDATGATRTSDDDGSTQTSAGGQGGEPDLGVGGTGGAGTGGEGTGATPHDCAEDVSTASLETLPADLIVVVDNSTSMALEAAQVKAQMNGFVGAITATGIDAHVVVISKASTNTFFDQFETGVCLGAPVGSGMCPDDEKLPAYRHVVEEVGSNDALQKVITTYDDWKNVLRPNATKTFLVVSDDESDMTPGEFTAALAALDPPITNFKFNAIVASQEGIASCALCAITGCSSCTNPCCDKSLFCANISQSRGQKYIDLQTQTGGVYGDLCTQNFAPAFADMAQAVIEHNQISCTFDIPTPPDGIIVPDETNVDFIPSEGANPQPIYNVSSEFDCTINGGWYFDNNTNPTTITLCDATCNAVKASTQGSVRVTYGCLTQQVPN